MDVPPLRVSRPVSACARCRGAKIKCDGKLPACSACEKAGKAKDCSSANDQFAKGKERSYVASLESRIERLERQISSCQTDGNSRPRRPSEVGSNCYRHAQPKEASDIDDLVSDFGYLSVNATASGYHGFTQEMSFARLVLSTACVVELPRASSTGLPARELGLNLVQEFMNKVLSMYPIFSDTLVFGSIEAVYRHNGRYCSPRECWNARLILAIASLLRSQAKGDVYYQNAVCHAALALEQREAVLQPGSIDTIQSLLLLVVYSTLDPTHFSCWYLIGVAARVMVDIGLHQELPTSNQTLSQVESRRRLFYCVYALDRVISITYTRYFSFSDDSIQVALPDLVKLSAHFNHSIDSLGALSINTSLEVTKFRQVQSAAFHSLFSSSREALSLPWQSRVQQFRKLGDWVSGLPESTPDLLRHLLLVEMFYLYVLLMLPPGGAQDLGSYGASLLLEYCIGFARNIWLLRAQSWGIHYCSNLDLLRVDHVGTITLNLLVDEVLSFEYDGELPVQSSHDEYLPPLQRTPPAEKITQAINCVTQLDETMNDLSRKFGGSRTYGTFKRRSSTALQRLYKLSQNSYSTR